MRLVTKTKTTLMDDSPKGGSGCLLKGQCDHQDWTSAADYVFALPQAQLANLPAAGHDAYHDQPANYLASIRALLDGTAVPGALDDPQHPPPDYQQPL